MAVGETQEQPVTVWRMFTSELDKIADRLVQTTGVKKITEPAASSFTKAQEEPLDIFFRNRAAEYAKKPATTHPFGHSWITTGQDQVYLRQLMAHKDSDFYQDSRHVPVHIRAFATATTILRDPNKWLYTVGNTANTIRASALRVYLENERQWTAHPDNGSHVQYLVHTLARCSLDLDVASFAEGISALNPNTAVDAVVELANFVGAVHLSDQWDYQTEKTAVLDALKKLAPQFSDATLTQLAVRVQSKQVLSALIEATGRSEKELRPMLWAAEVLNRFS